MDRLKDISYYYYGYYDGNPELYHNYLMRLAALKDLQETITLNSAMQIIANTAITTNVSLEITETIEKLNEEVKKIRIKNTDSQYFLEKSFKTTLDTLSNIEENIDITNANLNLGFSLISNRIGNLGVAFSQAEARIIDSIKIVSRDICERLDAINENLSNPLSLKARELYNRAQVSYKKGFFEEAIDDLHEAIQINKTDFYLWNLLGKLYLFGVSEDVCVIDIEKSITAFTAAAKYIKPDIFKDDYSCRLAAEISFFLGLAWQTKAKELAVPFRDPIQVLSIANAKKAYENSWSYSPDMLEALYNVVRCNILLGNINESLPLLETLILQDEKYYLKILADKDFQTAVSSFNDYLLLRKQNIINKSEEILKKLNEQILILKEKSIPVVQDYKYINRVLLQIDKASDQRNLFKISDLPYIDLRKMIDTCPPLIKKLESMIINQKEERLKLEIIHKKTLEIEARNKAHEIAIVEMTPMLLSRSITLFRLSIKCHHCHGAGKYRIGLSLKKSFHCHVCNGTGYELNINTIFAFCPSGERLVYGASIIDAYTGKLLNVNHYRDYSGKECHLELITIAYNRIYYRPSLGETYSYDRDRYLPSRVIFNENGEVESDVQGPKEEYKKNFYTWDLGRFRISLRNQNSTYIDIVDLKNDVIIHKIPTKATGKNIILNLRVSSRTKLIAILYSDGYIEIWKWESMH